LPYRWRDCHAALTPPSQSQKTISHSISGATQWLRARHRASACLQKPRLQPSAI
jgi:hypothetical protein